MLKKDMKHKGLKDMIVIEVIEDKSFNYRDEKVVLNILKKIEECIEESAWS